MKLKVNFLPIKTGSIRVVLIHEDDALKMDLHYSDRVNVVCGKKSLVAIVDIASADEVIMPGEVGMFEEATKYLQCTEGHVVDITLAKTPQSVMSIKKKLRGKRLTMEDFCTIAQDIIDERLTEVELSYFVAAGYIHEFNLEETVMLTKAMYQTGQVLKVSNGPVVDKHCIGGVAANRTTPVAVAILAAAGLTVPKTSSRSITSAAGTADTMEVLCNVSISFAQLKKIVKDVGACLVWGGALNLAPADDKIIRVEHPLSLDPSGQLIASILAKKMSVSATHVLIDIPVGKGAKIESQKEALALKKKFEQVGRRLGLKLCVVLTDGSDPVGNGVGPVLEMRDIIWTLQQTNMQCDELRRKSIKLAGTLFDLVGTTDKGNGECLAEQLLVSGAAYKKFSEIIRAQGGRVKDPYKLKVGKYKHDIVAHKNGTVTHVSNRMANKLARIAGSPKNKRAGIYIYVNQGDKVKKGDKLVRVYSDSQEKLEFAMQVYDEFDGIEIK